MSRLVPPAAPRTRVRSGGRSQAVRQRVATACLDLLVEGNVDLGPVDVARRAGVSRATLHRWWPTKADLLREMLAQHTSGLVVVDTGTWAGDVRALVEQLAAFFADPLEVGQNAIMASGAHPEYNAAVLEHYAPLFDGWRAVVERGRDRGEVADDVDVDVVLQLLASPLIVTPLLFRRTVSRRELDDLVTLVVRATAPATR